MNSKCEKILNNLINTNKIIFFSKYNFPKIQEKMVSLQDILEKEVDENFYMLTDLQKQMFTEDNDVKRYTKSNVVDKFEVYQIADISFPNGYNKGPRVHSYCPTLNTTTTKSCFVCKTINLQQKVVIRKITPKECFRLQGFDDIDYENTLNITNTSQLYKQTGNSICVSVLENIFKELIV